MTPFSSEWERYAQQLCSSYRHWLGRDLIESPAELWPARLWEAEFVVVSHAGGDDPIFNYANRRALELFEMTWDEFTTLPSRYSAEPMHRDERARLLATTRVQGYVDNYQGIRIAKSGRRFVIEQAILWNVLDSQGHYAGQAATFSHVRYLSTLENR